MIICICHRVSDRDIARAVRQGCTSFDELQCDLSVATACGACHDCARETFEQHAEACSPFGNSPALRAGGPAAADVSRTVHVLPRAAVQAQAAG